MHQRQWTAAALELQEEGYEQMPVPSNFPSSKEYTDATRQYINVSDGEHAGEGSWASGPTPDGQDEFEYLETPPPGVPMPPPAPPDERLSGTTPIPNPIEKVAGTVEDTLKKG